MTVYDFPPRLLRASPPQIVYQAAQACLDKGVISNTIIRRVIDLLAVKSLDEILADQRNVALIKDILAEYVYRADSLEFARYARSMIEVLNK